jgi:hypothetical protein
MQTKQIYIPQVSIEASIIEEVGGGADRVVYPGESKSLVLRESDFENKEEYHTAWIILTRAAQRKIAQNEQQHSD